MTLGLRRKSAELACNLLIATLPISMRPWGLAILAETRMIARDGEALRFALGSLFGVLPRALAEHFGRSDENAIDLETQSGSDGEFRSRALGIVCVVCATLLGLFYLGMAGAPSSKLAVNGLALLIGLAAYATLHRIPGNCANWSTLSVLVLAVLLAGTALLGEDAEGASRWVAVGSLTVQPSLLFLPVMISVFARWRNALSSAALSIAALALALQPDRAMSCILLLSLGALFISRRERHVTSAGVVSFASTIFAFSQPDDLTAVPFVDQVLYSAFDIHVLAGAAVMAGSILLIVPAVTALARADAHREVHLALGTVWLGTIIAAALWNYPTPVVGYGGSAIIGYILSLAVLPSCVSDHRTLERKRSNTAVDEHSDLRFALH